MCFTVSNINDEKYINDWYLYKNIHVRYGHTEGINYCVANISTGLETLDEALLGFTESVEKKGLFTEMTGLDW